MLLRFARAEASSHLDMMEAANACPDDARRAQYVAHAVDEARHATMFLSRALELDPSLAPHATRLADFEHLYARLGEAAFLSFVFVGERRAHAQLTLFRDELAAQGRDTKTKALFDAVLKDEARHVAYTQALTTQLGGSVARAHVWEFRRRWLRAGAVLGTALFSALTQALYLCLWPLAAVVKRR